MTLYAGIDLNSNNNYWVVINEHDQVMLRRKQPNPLGSILRSLEPFRGDGHYLSYCRMVESQKQSKGKKKGENNRKCGNRYLCWAFMEAAHFACRYYPEARA